MGDQLPSNPLGGKSTAYCQPFASQVSWGEEEDVTLAVAVAVEEGGRLWAEYPLTSTCQGPPQDHDREGNLKVSKGVECLALRVRSVQGKGSVGRRCLPHLNSCTLSFSHVSTSTGWLCPGDTVTLLREWRLELSRAEAPTASRSDTAVDTERGSPVAFTSQ